jgi:putative peptidoglycan lipid II flippase
MNKVISPIVKSSINLSFISGIGVILGLFKQILIAKYFGTSYQYDCFLIAFAIPSIFMGIAVTLFSSSLIPVLIPVKNEKEEYQEAINTIILLASIIILGLSIFGSLVSKYYLIYYTSFDKYKLDLTVNLAIYAWIITGFELLNYLLTSLFHIEKKFVFPAFIRLLIPISIIVCIYLGGEKLGIEAISIGWLLANITIFLLLSPILKKNNLSFKYINIHNKYVKEFIHVCVLTIIGTLPFTILPSIDGFWTARLPEGSMSYIAYCTQITIAIDTFVKNGVYLVLLPYLSENFATGEENIFWYRIRITLKYLYALLIPIVIYFSYFSQEIISFVYERGSFSNLSTKAISKLLPFYLTGGLLAMVPVTILNRAYYAQKKYASFAIISVALIFLYFILSGILSYLWQTRGIGIAYNIYWFSFLYICVKFLRKSFFDKEMVLFSIKLLAAALLSLTIPHTVLKVVNPFLKGIVSIMLLLFFTYLFKIPMYLEVKRYLKHIYD